MQLPYMVKYGLTPMQAIQSATLSAAQLMQWEDRVGSIAPGKYADIIAVEGDALADLQIVHEGGVRDEGRGGVQGTVSRALDPIAAVFTTETRRHEAGLIK